MKARILETVRVFKTRLLQTPFLLGWLAVGPLAAFYKDGWMGLAFGLVNIALAGVYALIIRLQTSKPDSEPVKRPTLELALALGLFVLFLLTQMLDFGVWNVQPWQGWVRNFFQGIGQWVYGLGMLPVWARQGSYIAFSSTIKQLIPTVLVFLLLGYKRRSMGLACPHWKLSATLVGITALSGLFSGVLFRAPLVQVVALYFIGILINALPEELFFRGMLLPRLEEVFANPLNALVVSALFFNAMHLPIAIHNGASLQMAVLDIFSIGYPSGLIWGYLYLRTRSVLPGMFWHAANINLGFMMMSL